MIKFSECYGFKMNLNKFKVDPAWHKINWISTNSRIKKIACKVKKKWIPSKVKTVKVKVLSGRNFNLILSSLNNKDPE